MTRTKKLIIAILIVILIGLLASIYGALNSGPNLTEENKDILLLTADKYEQSNGGVDMAFMIHLENGSFANYTPIYPHGMTHPTVAEPEEYQAMGAGSKLLLHDCFYWSDNQQCLQYAKEILEHNTNYTVDAVVAINSQALDNIISSAGTLKSNGEDVNASAIDFIREEQNTMGMTRGDSVMVIVNALVNAAKNPEKREKMMEAALKEYSEGHIAMYPEGSFAKLLASKGIQAMVG